MRRFKNKSKVSTAKNHRVDNFLYDNLRDYELVLGYKTDEAFARGFVMGRLTINKKRGVKYANNN